ncbi:MAG: winged helix-turn-helix domain-containing protein [Actinomycetota bacterium]
MRYRFLDYELDTERVRLTSSGEAQRIEPQVFEVLAYLIGARGRMVPKEELLDEVWGDRFVSESALTSRIKSARQAVGDSGTRQEVIRTVHGKGYEFVAAVTEVDASETDDGAPVGAAVVAPKAPSLPVALHQLIGRDESVKQVAEELGRSRLVTLVGPGGVGKTSLAYEVARSVADRFADGVVAVELVSVVDAEATVGAMATALAVHSRQDASLDDAVVDLLRSRELLLVLDNCEHLVGPVGEIVARVLRTAGGVSILATSREPLAVPGEQTWPVEPLGVGADAELPVELLDDVPAVALFVERAAAVDPRFVLTEDNAHAVVEICRRLDGVPLAIELAAARTRAVDVVDIAARLDERFRLLRGVRRGDDPRHQALQDTVRWSYDLLEPDEQRVFLELSVFAGSFDLEAAEEIVSDDLDALDLVVRLADRSMLAVRRGADGTRYEMLETLREYARTRLDDTDHVALFARHASYAVGLARSVERDLRGADEAHGISRANSAFADLRAGHHHALHVGDLDSACELVVELREYASRSMRYEALSWATGALALEGIDEHPLYPVLSGIEAYAAWIRGEFDRALELARMVEALGSDHAGAEGLALRVLGNVLYVQGDIDGGLAATARMLELAEESGQPFRVAHGAYMHSIATGYRDRELACELANRALAAAERSGSPTDRAGGLVAVGFAESDPEAALAAYAESERTSAAIGNRWMHTFAATEAAALLLTRGETEAACDGLADAVDVWFRAGEWSQQWQTLARCVLALDAIGQQELACQLTGAIERRATMGAPPVMSVLRDRMLERREALAAAVGAERFAELLEDGAELPVVDVVQRTRAALLGG